MPTGPVPPHRDTGRVGPVPDAPRAGSRGEPARGLTVRAPRAPASGGPEAAAADQWKESPQAQEPTALGLSMVKPCFEMVSSKSMDAPMRYGTLILSTMTSTPSS